MLVACERDFAFEGYFEPKIERLYLTHRAKLEEFFRRGPHLSAEQVALFALSENAINPLGEPTAVMINRRCFDLFGTFNDEFVSSCDTEYWYRVGTEAGVTVIPETLATFRVHADATSTENLGKRYYRAFYLDTLLLLDAFVHSPRFASLRSTAAKYQFDLTGSYRQKKNQARALADWSAQANDDAPLLEWRELVRKHATLAPSFVEHFVWRARNRFASH
jgi:hypothetical protein